MPTYIINYMLSCSTCMEGIMVRHSLMIYMFVIAALTVWSGR